MHSNQPPSIRCWLMFKTLVQSELDAVQYRDIYTFPYLSRCAVPKRRRTVEEYRARKKQGQGICANPTCSELKNINHPLFAETAVSHGDTHQAPPRPPNHLR